MNTILTPIVGTLAADLHLLIKQRKTISWQEMCDLYVKIGVYTRTELIVAMNSILIPHGDVSGDSTFYFWIGTPQMKPEIIPRSKK